MASWDDVLAETGGEFIKGPEKALLYEQQQPFGIINVRPAAETQFGLQTLYQVKLASAPDVLRTLGFTHNDYREAVAVVAAKKLTEDPTPLGPCYLRKFTTKGGNEGWEISGTPLDPPPGKQAGASSGDATPDFLKG